jgi:hypothetical protein
MGGPQAWAQRCGCEECRTGWLHLFRRTSVPRFEARWGCSRRCMERIVADAVRGLIENWNPGGDQRDPRMPLGLILLSRGWIGRRELRDALEAQRAAGSGRLGEWLSRLHAVDELTIAKGLAIQWNCAVLPGASVEPAAGTIPGFLERQYGLVLVRHGRGEGLYLAARDAAEHATCRALEHVLGVRVQPAFLEDSCWRRFAEGALPEEAVREPGTDGVAAQIAALVETERPLEARLARVRDHLWLRMWLARGRTRYAADTLFSLRSAALTLPDRPQTLKAV